MRLWAVTSLACVAVAASCLSEGGLDLDAPFGKGIGAGDGGLGGGDPLSGGDGGTAGSAGGATAGVGGNGGTTASGGFGASAAGGTGGTGAAGGPAAPLFATLFGSSGFETIIDVALDGADNRLLVGVFDQAIDFGDGPLMSAGQSDAFVAKLAPNHDVAWTHRIGDGEFQRGWAIAAEPAGSSVVMGHFAGSVDFGGGAISASDGSDMFVAKLDAQGGELFSKRVVMTFVDPELTPDDVAIGPSGEIVLAGGFEITADFGGGLLTSAGSADIYVAKLDAQGNHVWSMRRGDADQQFVNSVVVDAQGDIVVAGTFRGVLDLGGATLTANAGPNKDVFIAKLDPQGNHVWSRHFGATTFECCPRLAARRRRHARDHGGCRSRHGARLRRPAAVGTRRAERVLRRQARRRG